MSIDWITVSAQIVNFLILVWLLKRFLYQPVLRAMDRREERVTARLSDAEQREQLAHTQQQQFQDKENELAAQREKLIGQAREEAEQEKQQLLREARENVNAVREQWQKQANEEKDEFLKNLQHKVAESMQAVTRKALGDLADASLENQMIEVFLQRLQSMDENTRETLNNSNDPISIASSFDLDAEARKRLTSALNDTRTKKVDIQFDTSPELLCGIQLTCGGQRLSWNLAEYLDELQQRVERSFAPLESAGE